jgi:hypothetical protein
VVGSPEVSDHDGALERALTQPIMEYSYKVIDAATPD